MKALDDLRIQEVKDLTQSFLTALRSGDSDTFFSFIDDYIDENTELITPEGKIVKGEDLIPFYHEFFGPLFQSFDADGGFYDEEYTVSGDLAVHRYSYKLDLTPKEGGETIAEIGYGVKIYKNHLDGSWKLQYDIWTNPE